MTTGAASALPRRLAAAASATLALVAGLWIAIHHPIAAVLAAVGFGLAIALNLRWPGLWLTLLPAAMPVLDASPWTGWIVVDEFDLLVLATLAGGHARLAWTPNPSLRRWPSRVVWLALIAAVSCAIGLARGWLDAAPSGAGWFQSYADPANAWRVAKSLVFALALLPLLKREVDRSASRAFSRVASGMLIGLLLVAIAVLRERIAYPGWLEFSIPYRTVGWFWEMHVGGAAIDAYLALATPFVAWALWRAHRPARFALVGGLALLVGYAALTTFSRGVYLATLAPLLGLALWVSARRFGFDVAPWLRRVAMAIGVAALLALGTAWVQANLGAAAVIGVLALQVAAWLAWVWRTRRWRRGASVMLASALMVEAIIVLGAGSFMLSRIAASQYDFGSRVEHWRAGLGLLQTPGQWLFGLGLGRLPAHYAGAGRTREFSGAVGWVAPSASEPAHATLSGAPTSRRLSGLLRMTQRVPLQSAGPYTLALKARASTAAWLAVSVCEQHLLYARRCQAARLLISPSSSHEWHFPLAGPLLAAGSAWAPREAVLALSVSTPGAAVEIEHVGLTGPDGRELLANRYFSDGLARWFPSAVHYFLPWHIDNLYLELLIERGLTGLAAIALLFGSAAALPCSMRGQGHAFAPFLAASIVGVLIVGLVSSVMDVPRVALLFLLLAFFGAMLEAEPAPNTGAKAA